MSLSKIMTIGSWLNVIALGWLLVARVVPAEQTNMTVFWVFLGLALLTGMAYATSLNPGKSKPLNTVPDFRRPEIVGFTPFDEQGTTD